MGGEAWGPAYGADDGSVRDTLARAVAGPTEVENPYGEATVRYARDGVPHVTAGNTTVGHKPLNDIAGTEQR